MIRFSFQCAATGAAFLFGLGALCAQPIFVPNGSFELPAITFVSTRIASWQETPKPDDYVEGGGFEWDQLTGVFRNTSPASADHIDNCDGVQAAYFFAVPSVGLFQDYVSQAWNEPAPTHALDARFEVGRAYELKFGAVAGGGNMLEGVSFEAALYFRNDAGNPFPVAATNVVFTRETFPNRTHLSEFTLRTPVVQAGDAWAGQHLGIRFLSTVSPEMQGGYWDLDHIRLTALGETAFAVQVAAVGSDVRLTWPSVTGSTYQVKVSENLGAWSDYGNPQSGTGGELSQLIPLAERAQAFFRVVTAPAP